MTEGNKRAHVMAHAGKPLGRGKQGRADLEEKVTLMRALERLAKIDQRGPLPKPPEFMIGKGAGAQHVMLLAIVRGSAEQVLRAVDPLARALGMRVLALRSSAAPHALADETLSMKP